MSNASCETAHKVLVTPLGNHWRQAEIINWSESRANSKMVTEADTLFFGSGFKGRVRCGSKFVESDENNIVSGFIGKGQPFVVEAVEMENLWVIHLHEAPTHSESRNNAPVALYQLHSGSDFLMAKILDKLMNQQMTETEFDEFFASLKTQLEPSADLPATGNWRLAERLRKIIADSDDKQINLTEISKSLGCHPSQLSREFSKFYGLAPYRYSFLLRLAKAREALRSGMGLAEIAARFEFSDQSHFTRAFRQVYQMTPNSYRSLYGVGGVA